MAYRVLIPQTVDQAGIDYLKKRSYEIRMGSGITADIIRKEIADCDALYLRTAPITREILMHAKKLKVISRYGVGVDNIDLEAAKELGIYVVNSPVANVTTVAEHTIGFIIACSRSFYKGDQATRNGDFEYRNREIGFDLAGKTLGLLGIGKIASEVARKAILGLDMNVIAYDPYVPPDRAPEGVTMVPDREDVFRNADFVSVHVPATAETRDSIGASEFSMMKPSAYFINCGRGVIVREGDLIQALQENRIAGAALDVFNPEPPAADNPLFRMRNVILSPHNAGLTQEAAIRISLDAVEGIDDVINGRKPKYPIVIPE